MTFSKGTRISFFLGLLLYFCFSSVAHSGEEIGGVYVLSVGIDDYQFLPTMKASVNSAGMVVDSFRSSVLARETILMTDKAATKINIMDTLRRIGRVMAPKDLLLFYYAGHGGTNSLYWKSATKQQSGYANWRDDNIYDEDLLPVDATYDRATHVSMEDLRKLIKEGKIENFICIVDGAYAVQGTRSAFNTFENVDRLKRPRSSIRDLSAYGPGVIWNADWDETGKEYLRQGVRVGIFTKYLTDGITNKGADFNKDGHLTVDEIYDYAANMIGNFVATQHPQFYSGKNKHSVIFEYRR